MEDPHIQTYDEFVSKRDDPKKKLGKNLNNTQITVFAVVGFILIYSTFIAEPPYLTRGQAFMVAGLAGFIGYLVLLKDSDEDYIDLREARAIFVKELQYMQKITNEIPYGNILLTVPGSLKQWDGKPDCYYLGAIIEDQYHDTTSYIGKITPKGKVVGIMETNSYFDAMHVKDSMKVEAIRTKRDRWADQYEGSNK
jgi:hypothetical protein